MAKLTQTILGFTKRFNLGNYEHEEYSISTAIGEDAEALEEFGKLKGLVSAAKEAEEIPWPEGEADAPKTNKSDKAKTGKGKPAKPAEEEEEEETEEEEEEEEETEEEETEEEEDKPKKGKDKLRPKGSVYDRNSDLHKKLFMECMRELMTDKWVNNVENKARIKAVSMKMKGKDFLDADGDVVEEFQTEMKKLAKAK